MANAYNCLQYREHQSFCRVIQNCIINLNYTLCKFQVFLQDTLIFINRMLWILHKNFKILHNRLV